MCPEIDAWEERNVEPEVAKNVLAAEKAQSLSFAEWRRGLMRGWR